MKTDLTQIPLGENQEGGARRQNPRRTVVAKRVQAEAVPAAALTALGPWLEAIDRVLQGLLARQQQKPDDRFDMETLLLPMDETGRHATPPCGMPLWSRQAPSAPWLDGVTMPPAQGRLAEMIARFGLTSFETQVLVLAALPLFEIRYTALLAYLQGDDRAGWPDVNLALTLFSATPVHRLAHQLTLNADVGPLFRHGLVLSVDRSGYSTPQSGQGHLRLSDMAFAFLCGVPAEELPVGDAPAVRWLPQASGPSLCDGSWSTCAADIDRLCFRESEEGGTAVDLLLLQGGHGRETLVSQRASARSCPVLSVDLAGLPSATVQAHALLRKALQAVQLTAGLLLFKGWRSGVAVHPDVLQALEADLAVFPRPVVVLTDASEAAGVFPGLSRLSLTLPPRAFQDDASLLQVGLGGVTKDWAWSDLLSRTRINPDALIQTLQEAHAYRLLRDPAAPLAEQDLQCALRMRGQQHFGELAQRISPRRTFDDLIVTDGLAEHLKDILAAMRQRDAVLGRGFAHKIGYGTGISALFYGSSGTGKSMAAEVLAEALGLDLIRVDLSTVVNKYIGETEKNLAKIFDMAIADTGVLLFDEADALFGKRSEVKDAQDRHANIEVSYLLQRLEQYPGLVVLTSNNRAHLDEAFTRRLTFIARFDAPDVALREQMWRAIWPAQVSVEADVSWAQWAQVKDLTGAGIRNVALMASWLAAESGRAVSHDDIAQAVRRELDKTGRIMPTLLQR